MQYTTNDYRKYIRQLMHSVGVMKTRQLILFVKNKYNITEESVLGILKSMQKSRYLFLSQDGWVMTVGAYTQYADDKFYDRIITAPTDYSIMYDFENHLEIDKELVECLWFASDRSADIEGMVLGHYPFKVNFISRSKDDPEGKLFQIMYVSKENENACSLLLKSMPPIDGEEARSSIKRVAFIEDERHAWIIPNIGFAYVCVIDPKDPKGYRIIDDRTQKDIWEDMIKDGKD